MGSAPQEGPQAASDGSHDQHREDHEGRPDDPVREAVVRFVRAELATQAGDIDGSRFVRLGTGRPTPTALTLCHGQSVRLRFAACLREIRG
jgi:hypothetical protein